MFWFVLALLLVMLWMFANIVCATCSDCSNRPKLLICKPKPNEASSVAPSCWEECFELSNHFNQVRNFEFVCLCFLFTKKRLTTCFFAASNPVLNNFFECSTIPFFSAKQTSSFVGYLVTGSCSCSGKGWVPFHCLVSGGGRRIVFLLCVSAHEPSLCVINDECTSMPHNC